MLVENQYAIVKWWYSNKEHYINLGYKFTKIKDEFNVPIEHLAIGSHEIVNVKCDYCGKIKNIEYRDYIKRHDEELGDCCHGCNYIKSKRTNLERYGVENVCNCQWKKDKAKETNLKNNGCEYPMQNKNILNKANITNMKKYGVKRPLQNKELFNKFKNTCLERFGVEYYPLTDEHRIKTNETYFKNGTTKTSKQQFKLYEDLKEIYGECELNYPLGKYSLDCMIKIDGVLIDVEYDGWYWHQDEDKDNKRDKFVINNGYKVFRIKGGLKNPSKKQIIHHISNLTNSENILEIMLLESRINK